MIKRYLLDCNSNLISNSDGDIYIVWTYDDNNHIVTEEYISNDSLVNTRHLLIKDKFERLIKEVWYNSDNQPLKMLDTGAYGIEYHYNDEEHSKTISYLGETGNPFNNINGYAHRIIWYDPYGRAIARKDIDAEGNIQGQIPIAEFIENNGNINGYYRHNEDAEGNIIPFDNGSIYNYYEDDEEERTLKCLYLDACKKPLPDEDGDYGVAYEYDNTRSLTTMICLDKEGLPHNNIHGYGIVRIIKDSHGQEIKRQFFTVDDSPIIIEKNCYGFIFEYPSEYSRIIGYLNEKGEITTNSDGYAFREECFDPETGLNSYFFYDINRNNIQSLEDDCKEYGYAIKSDGKWRRVISLGKDGNVANNALGYSYKFELYEDNRIRFSKFPL